MTWQTNHADVMSQVLATKLCAEADLECFLKQFLLEVDVAECTASLVARCRQVVIIFD